MEPNLKAAADSGSWLGICRSLADITFTWQESGYSGSWLAAGTLHGEPVLFWGSFGSCSGCDSLEAAYDDPEELERIVRAEWEGRIVGAGALVEALERFGNDAWCEGAREASMEAAAALGLTITLMEVEP